jgi:hypothetical protein
MECNNEWKTIMLGELCAEEVGIFGCLGCAITQKGWDGRLHSFDVGIWAEGVLGYRKC